MAVRRPRRRDFSRVLVANSDGRHAAICHIVLVLPTSDHGTRKAPLTIPTPFGPCAAYSVAQRKTGVPRGQRANGFRGRGFLRRWAIPNVFFHVTTAYAILRHNGVEIGKRDFLGALREV